MTPLIFAMIKMTRVHLLKELESVVKSGDENKKSMCHQMKHKSCTLMPVFPWCHTV